MQMKFTDKPKENYFLSQPHQPFFMLAFTNAIVSMLLFLLAYKGVVTLHISAMSFHAYALVYLLFTPAFIAFLFTTFPRFTSTPAIEKKVYMRVLGLFYIGSIIFILGSIISPILPAIGAFLVFLGHVYSLFILKNIYNTTKMPDKHDIFWIYLAMGIGVLSHFAAVTASLLYPVLVPFAIQSSIYLYLFLLTFTIAQRMVPFFSHSMVEKNKNLMKVVFVLLVLHVIAEAVYPASSFLFDAILAIFIAKEIYRWNFHFPDPNPLLWVLHIALFWIPLALLLSAVSNLTTILTGMSFLALDIHLITLGFIFTILIGFGTRVTLGHSGNRMQAGKWEKALFFSTQALVLLRVTLSILASQGMNFMIIFDITATLWILLLLAWAIRFFPVLIFGKKLS